MADTDPSKTPTEPAALPVSPTGTPLIPAAAFRWIALGVLLALAILGVLVGFYPEVRGFQVALSIVTSIGVLFGITSPGLRKTALPLVLVCFVGLSGCAFFKSIRPKLVGCTVAPASDVVIAVTTALEGDQDWQKHLEGVAVSAGLDTVICAVGVVIAALENTAPNGGAGTPAPCMTAPCPVDPQVKLVRAYHFLEVQNAQPAR